MPVKGTSAAGRERAAERGDGTWSKNEVDLRAMDFVRSLT